MPKRKREEEDEKKTTLADDVDDIANDNIQKLNVTIDLKYDWHKTLTCPVCLNFISTQILQCRNGHLICSDCSVKLIKIADDNEEELYTCPQCREPTLFTRNLIVEQLILNSSIKCQYTRNGCTENLNRSNVAEHEKHCKFKPRNCPISKTCAFTFDRNAFNGKNIELINHCLSHNNDENSMNQINLVLDAKNDEYHSWFVIPPNADPKKAYHVLVIIDEFLHILSMNCNLVDTCFNIKTYYTEDNKIFKWIIKFSGTEKEKLTFCTDFSKMENFWELPEFEVGYQIIQGCVSLIVKPQIDHKMELFRHLITYQNTKDGSWYATCPYLMEMWGRSTIGTSDATAPCSLCIDQKRQDTDTNIAYFQCDLHQKLLCIIRKKFLHPSSAKIDPVDMEKQNSQRRVQNKLIGTVWALCLLQNCFKSFKFTSLPEWSNAYCRGIDYLKSLKSPSTDEHLEKNRAMENLIQFPRLENIWTYL